MLMGNIEQCAGKFVTSADDFRIHIVFPDHTK